MRCTHLAAAAALLIAPVSATAAPAAQVDGPSRHPALSPRYPGRLVSSERLQADIQEQPLLQRSQTLQDIASATPERNRVFGSVGHNATTKYIFDTMAELSDYYRLEYQRFVDTYSGGNATVAVDGQAFEATLMTYTPGGTAQRPMIPVSSFGCDAADFPATIEGNVALISRGNCSFGTKAARAGVAGAAGAIVYNNVKGSLMGTLNNVSDPIGPYAPTVAVSLESGQALLELARSGASVDLEVDVVTENRTTQNVIAQSKGGDQNNVLVIGGHSDSVQAGPGINDDGSGTVGILEIAIQLAKYRINNAVRIIWWSAEEFGLRGSRYYVRNLAREERDKIRLYLNFDMIASPNYIYGIYDGDGSSFNVTGPPGSAEAERTFEDYFRAKNLPFQGVAFTGRSDYVPFVDVGIPAGGLFTGADSDKTAEEAVLYGGTAGAAYDPNYHAAGDTFANLNAEAFVVNTRAIADAVAKYAVSFDSLPPATNRTITKRDVKSERSGGCFHDHEEAVAM